MSSLKNYSVDDLTQLARQYQKIVQNKFIPVTPTERQLTFLMIDNREAFYGGAAGGGKTEGLLMGAAMYVDHPSYNAIIFRKTYPELKHSVILRSKEWWLSKRGTPGRPHWNGSDFVWTFPSGARIQFGALNYEDDHLKYSSAEYQYIAFDEVPEIDPFQYRFMATRLRRTRVQEAEGIPLRIRAAGNPVGPFVPDYKVHFNLPNGDPNRPFVPAFIDDNPYLDQESYKKNLKEALDPIMLARMMEGDWTIADEGKFFKRIWFTQHFSNTLPQGMAACRYWDKAATAKAEGRNPAFTAGVLMATDGTDFYIMDVRHFRGSPKTVRSTILSCAQTDTLYVDDRTFASYRVAIEQEGGSAGVEDMDHYATLLVGYPFLKDKVTGSKAQRADAYSTYAELGRVKIYIPLDRRVTWDIEGYLDELTAFPEYRYKDRVDASSGAFNALARPYRAPKAKG